MNLPDVISQFHKKLHKKAGMPEVEEIQDKLRSYDDASNDPAFHEFVYDLYLNSGLVKQENLLKSYCKTLYMTFNREPISHDRSVPQRVGETPRNSCRFARSTVAIGDDG